MKVLWICLVWPEPQSSAAGVRTRQLIEVCHARFGAEFSVCSPCHPNKYQKQLDELGIQTSNIAANDQGFDLLLKDFQPDLVFFDRFMIEEQFSWRVRQHCPDAMRILDTIDLHSLRRVREKLTASGRSSLTLSDSDLQSKDALREIAAIFRSDLTLLVSSFEIELLKKHFHLATESLELVRPFYKIATPIIDFEERKNFVTIGNFNHAPNLDSVKILHNSIWPMMRQQLAMRGVYNVELHVYGAYPNQVVNALDDRAADFRVLGWAEDVQSTLSRYRVNLAALRFGAGIKGKICDGWSVGTPCAATTIAAEGICDQHSFGGVVEHDFMRFAEQSIELYQNLDRWNQAQRLGFEVLKKSFDQECNTKQFLAALEDLGSNLVARRERNFIGAMLWYHANRSSEYFSRWIEAKNGAASDRLRNVQFEPPRVSKT